jgi:hypothetical protein
MWHSIQGRVIGGMKVPFQVAPMQLETLNQPVGNNECGFYVIWAMLLYLDIKLEQADALVCTIPISFISVNSTKRSTVISYICAFLISSFLNDSARNLNTNGCYTWRS